MKQRQINLIAFSVAILVILVLLGGSIVFNYYLEDQKTIKTEEKNSSKKEEKPKISNTYDTSSFEKIKLVEYFNIFKSSETTFLYFGRSTCSACKYYVPILNNVQKIYGFKVYYIDSDTVDYNGDLFQQFLTLDEQIKNNFGGVPLTIVAKNGQVVNLNVGALNNDQLIEFLKKSDIVGDINE